MIASGGDGDDGRTMVTVSRDDGRIMVTASGDGVISGPGS